MDMGEESSSSSSYSSSSNNASVIDSSNIGFKLLKKHGWKEGTGLGASEQGRLEPVQTYLKNNKHGLGAVSNEKNVLSVSIQSAYCEVCKINCNAKSVLDKHKLGKKHKKNLEKLNNATASAQSSAESDNPAIGSQEPPDIGDKGEAVDLQNSRKKATEPVEDLETKRRKVLQGGAAAEAVRTCAMCNVVCNSEAVFNSHLAGQKHADMMKKHAGEVLQRDGDKGEAVDLQNSRKKAVEPVEPVEDLETKRRKVLQGGAAAEAVRESAFNMSDEKRVFVSAAKYV
ncbi:uncharacterized protein LOC133867103 isoform X2 [Alnus glutinosa]|uniref:uncharacterized protein LOC133867103 isoform X2 n=1 Tax=Alnus glutinosa TaxID=3517 RepID=UPI002D78A571|nr:uncharacterized protein LOC133867103 isoform X2 [Alnus glutinosa]